MIHLPPEAPRGSHLEQFLARAYDPQRLAELLRARILAAGSELASLLPLRAHLTKDNRLVAAYRLEIFSPRESGLRTVLAFLHDCALTREPVLKRYRDLEQPGGGDRQGRREEGIRRHFLRTGEDEFLALFPRDPDLRPAIRLLRPAAARDLYNEAMTDPAFSQDNPGAATGISVRMLGYRPERRLVAGLFPVSPAGADLAPCIVKFSRRGDAERMWSVSRTLAGSPAACVTAWPLARIPSAGALVYPLVEGDTLHHLMERGWATPAHLGRTGALLKQFHSTLASAPAEPSLRTFTFSDELDILERWRRFLKQSGSREHGFVARHLRLLAGFASTAPSPDALVHRDFYPKQIVVHPWLEQQKLIDIDTMAWGPAAVDLGNFLAHVDLAEFANPGSGSRAEALRRAFVEGYGEKHDHGGVRLFRFSTLLRLFCLSLVGPEAALLVPPLRHAVHTLAEEL